MKKLLSLLVLIPILSYSQISYEDIVSVDSESSFKKVIMENGYELTVKNDSLLHYGLSDEMSYLYDEQVFNKWVVYHRYSGLFVIMYDERVRKDYDSITNDIKENCEFYEVIEFGDNDYVTYSCSKSKSDEKIGFSIIDGRGTIMSFPLSIINK